MSIEEIPSNELTEMTEPFHKAFNVLGCNPACHSCWKKITPGMLFKLATVKPVGWSNPHCISGVIEEYDNRTETKEVMLCETCTPEEFDRRQLSRLKQDKKRFDETPGKESLGCFRINGKIIH